jgi:hypothetical protein
LGSKVRDLRFEGADEVGGCIDDGTTEFENRIRPVGQMAGYPQRVWIEPNAEQRIAIAHGRLQLLSEFGIRRGCQGRCQSVSKKVSVKMVTQKKSTGQCTD